MNSLLEMPATQPSPVSGVALRVEVRGIAEPTGAVILALYDRAETFLKTPAATAAVPVAGATVLATFPDLAPGDYAVVAFHDLNGNGQLDRNMFGRPVEPLGFSRDASGSMGPPTFEAATVSVGAAGVAIVINLR